MNHSVKIFQGILFLMIITLNIGCNGDEDEAPSYLPAKYPFF